MTIIENIVILSIAVIIYFILMNLFSKDSFESFSSCYEANNDNNCYTCDEVILAYKRKGLIYDKNIFEQCK